MDLVDYLPDDLIFLDFAAADKNMLLKAMVQKIAVTGRLDQPEIFLQEMLERESLSSTGIGNGVAVPHARSEQLKSILVAFVRLERGIDFGSEDGQPVQLVFIIGTPLKEIGEYIHILAQLARKASDETVRQALGRASTPFDVKQILMG